MIKDLRDQNHSLHNQVEKLMEDLRNIYISNHNQNDSFRPVRQPAAGFENHQNNSNDLNFRRSEAEKAETIEKVFILLLNFIDEKDPPIQRFQNR